ncbi:hypothetical protein [Streptomyces sp. NBRC 109706]|uniref:hypothetical protein n=1 Tax=Streptomyces sp. NBRC 109706 TaxID=1550035 RepID=UPI0007825088|nr:hypothetical protein [Streptomyces sp. NBRC 109706]
MTVRLPIAMILGAIVALVAFWLALRGVSSGRSERRAAEVLGDRESLVQGLAVAYLADPHAVTDRLRIVANHTSELANLSGAGAAEEAKGRPRRRRDAATRALLEMASPEYARARREEVGL